MLFAAKQDEQPFRWNDKNWPTRVCVCTASVWLHPGPPAPINTCKMSSWSCDCFCLILSSRRCLSTCQESQVRIWETMHLADDGDRPTSRFWHSCAELVGRPIHLISFFSLEMMFMAMRTFSASYTRRRMFFWSYTCFENTQPWRRYDKLVCLKASGSGHLQNSLHRWVTCGCLRSWILPPARQPLRCRWWFLSSGPSHTLSLRNASSLCRSFPLSFHVSWI